MHIGFIHGVMNTDNMAISGETIDYGPCAFMDIFSMNKVFSSIDQNGRYEYGSQAHIAHWNLTKLAESLLPLLHENMDEAMKLAEVAISEYANDFNSAWISGMRSKLGLLNEEEGDYELAQNLLEWMESSKADFTVPLGIFHMKIFLIKIFIILLTLKNGMHYGRQDYQETQNQ